MIIEDDRIYVESELLGYISAYDFGRSQIVQQVRDPGFKIRLGYHENPQALVVQAVSLCIENMWRSSPPLIVRLINIIPKVMRQPRLEEIREHLSHPPPIPDPALDPLNATILRSDVPFIDRVSLRTKLGQIAGSTGRDQPILVITGASKTGKSYSTNYIDHFSAVTQGITTYRIVFDPEQGPELGPRELALDMVRFMGPLNSQVPDESTNRKRYVQQLAQWVLSESMRWDPYHWFILDNFNGTELRQDTRDFLVTLSDMITNGRYADFCRLILIGFDRAHLTVNPGKVDEEEILPATINDAECAIGDVLKRYQIDLNSKAVSDLLFSGVPNGEMFMQELNTGISSLIFACAKIKAIVATIPDARTEVLLEKIVGGLPFGPERRTELKTRLDNLRTSAQLIVQ